eukprot:239982-Amphidinium_carterae.1
MRFGSLLTPARLEGATALWVRSGGRFGAVHNTWVRLVFVNGSHMCCRCLEVNELQAHSTDTKYRLHLEARC